MLILGLMKFFFGLGNPGKKYAATRHNAGHMFLDYWLNQLISSPSWKQQKKLKAELIKINQKLFIKPTCFMNNSGEAVRAVVDYYGQSGQSLKKSDLAEKIFIAHDDLDLELGSHKIQRGVGPQGHNGLLSVYQHLGTDQFWHIRIGVDDRLGDRSIPPQNYVLQKLPQEKKEQLVQGFDQIINHLPRLNV